MLGLPGNIGDGLPFSQKLAYGLGHVMNDICSAMWFSYMLLFFEVVLKMPSTIAGGLICVGQVADAVASPIIGIFVDRFGTRKFWHLLGTTILSFTFPLTFTNNPWLPDIMPGNSTNETSSTMTSISWANYDLLQSILGVIYFSFLVVVFQVGWATVQISHLAIIPELTPVKTERANLTAIRYTANFAAYMFVFLITWLVLHITEGSQGSVGVGDAYKFRAIVLLGLLIGGICTLTFHGVLETTVAAAAVTKSSPETKNLKTWFRVIKKYFKTCLLYQVTWVYFMSRMITCISLIYLPLFLVEKKGIEPEYIAILPLVSYLASFVASLFVRQVRSCFSNKVNYVVGAVVSVLGSVWVAWGYTVTEELFGMAILLGAGGSITGVASLSLCADLIGTDTENGAFIYSVVTAVDKLLCGIVVMAIEGVKTKIFVSSTHYFQNVLAYGCGISGALGLAVLLTMLGCANKRLTEPSESSAKN